MSVSEMREGHSVDARRPPDFANAHPGYACLKENGRPVPQATTIADYVEA
jgi:hypothetical protein